MMYTKMDFSKELKKRVLEKQSVEQIGKWAFEIYLNWPNRHDVSFSNLLLTLSAMENGPEFALTYTELNEIAKRLLDQFRKEDPDTNNKISLGFEILNHVRLSNLINDQESVKTWFGAIEKKYKEYEDDSVDNELKSLRTLIQEEDLSKVKILALQLITELKDQYILLEENKYDYDQIRLGIELFFQIDQEYLTQQEIAQWAKNTKEMYEHDMDPKVKEILTELEIMAYMKELEKGMEELKNLSINLIKKNIKK